MTVHRTGRWLPALLLALLASRANAANPQQLEHGAQVYERCAACHAIDRNRTGPQHCGLFQRRSGQAPGFAQYSPAMRKAGIAWNAITLDRFLRDPAQMVPGTSMGYAGVKDPTDRADLIAWMQVASRAGVSCRPQ